MLIRLALATLVFGVHAAESAIPITCETMTNVELPHLRITAAERVTPAPVWVSPDSIHLGPAAVQKPFCRVQGMIENEIRFELWLPAPSEWNGRFLGAGNGGDAGFINDAILARGVNRGFAAASTDTGHKLSDEHWALGHPDRLENYGFRAQHLMAVDAKKLIDTYYGRSVAHAYFLGCSGGGMQGMNEAQRYPADYDGIVAGASGSSMVPLSSRFLMSAILKQDDPTGVLTPEDWKSISTAAVKSCDAKDGVTDGVIEDPRTCHFEVTETPNLSAAKARQAKALLGPLRDEQGRVLYPGFPSGAAFSSQDRQIGIATRFFGEWLYQDADWDVHRFNLARDYAAVEDVIAGMRFNNPDLEPLARRGGKLITYVGWSDPIVPATSDIDYYERVSRFLGKSETQQFFRLFMVPGMGHCSGGAGATEFGQAFMSDPPDEDAEHDVLTAIVEWVEAKRVPDVIIAVRQNNGAVTMTRPLCAYPKVPQYRKKGDPNDSASFECLMPRRGL